MSDLNEDLANLAEMLKGLKKKVKEDKAVAETPDSLTKEATLVLKSLYHPDSVVTRVCKECEREFQTDYAYKFYCTRKCLKVALEKVGIAWDPDKTEVERWNGEPPSTIYPDTLVFLKKWAKAILESIPDSTSPRVAPTPPDPPPARNSFDDIRALLED